MTRFFGILTAVLITISIASCSDSPGNDSPYPVQVGSFSLQSDTQAEWTGINFPTIKRITTSATGDTLRFSQPDSLSMLILATNVTGGFAVVITDSTITGDYILNNEIHSDVKEITSGEDGIELTGTGTSGGAGDPVSLQYTGTFSCDSTVVYDDTEFIYSLFEGEVKPENHVKSYVLVTNGFRPVLDRLVCDAPL